jgi:hypothetical protein
MTIKVEIEKHPLQNFAPSRYCEWCVTISTDDPAGFTDDTGQPAKLQWALDFPPDTDILDPEQAKKIKGAPKYTLDPAPDTGTRSHRFDKQVKICFVAACQDRAGVEMSLENRVNFPAGAGMAPREWQRVPYDGGPGGLGAIVGPAAVAMAAPGGQQAASALALRAGRIYLTGKTAAERPRTARRRPSRARRSR